MTAVGHPGDMTKLKTPPATDAGTLAETYFRAWKDHDWTTLRSLLADDATFRGPLGSADDADTCIRGLQGMAQILTDIVIHKRFVDGPDVLTWFDLHTSVAPPAPTANWSHVENGRITTIRVTFDARPPARAAGGGLTASPSTPARSHPPALTDGARPHHVRRTATTTVLRADRHAEGHVERHPEPAAAGGHDPAGERWVSGRCGVFVGSGGLGARGCRRRWSTRRVVGGLGGRAGRSRVRRRRVGPPCAGR